MNHGYDEDAWEEHLREEEEELRRSEIARERRRRRSEAEEDGTAFGVSDRDFMDFRK